MDESTLPRSAVPPPVSGAPGPGAREPRTLPASRGLAWWSEGWQVFTAAPGTWLLIVVVLLLIVVALAFVPVLGNLAQSLLAPIFAGGIALGCRALAKGRPLEVGHLFEGFAGGRLLPLLVVGMVYLAAMIVLWIVVLAVILGVAGGAGLFSALTADPSQLGVALLASFGMTALAVAPLAVVAVALLGMAYWYAPALVVLNGEEPIAAMKKSFGACLRNVGAMLVYGLVLIGLSIAASIPFALGWIVLAPVMAGSWYAGWREMFDE